MKKIEALEKRIEQLERDLKHYKSLVEPAVLNLYTCQTTEEATITPVKVIKCFNDIPEFDRTKQCKEDEEIIKENNRIEKLHNNLMLIIIKHIEYNLKNNDCKIDYDSLRDKIMVELIKTR